MKAPLIAMISVGIAAAAPAVAISAKAPNTGAAESQQAPTQAPVTDPRQPIGPVSFDQQGKKEDARNEKLVKRYTRLRKRANRLLARRDHHKVRPVGEAGRIVWPSHVLKSKIRRLHKLIERVRWDIRARRAGLTPALQRHLDSIAICESHGNPRSIGGGGIFRGKYQFMFSTWASVGGKGDPARAPEREQDLRAAMLLNRSGSSPWPVCG
jgi:hypothetical protein